MEKEIWKVLEGGAIVEQEGAIDVFIEMAFTANYAVIQMRNSRFLYIQQANGCSKKAFSRLVNLMDFINHRIISNTNILKEN